MKNFIIIVSFLLEGVISNFVKMNGYFTPLFTLIALIIIYPLFKDGFSYYKYAFITGLAYDLFYTNTIVFHAIIFSFIAFLITKLNLILSDNFVNVLIIISICILFYRMITYGLLVLTGDLSFNIEALMFSVLKSLILNLSYSLVLFVIVKKNQKKISFF